MRRNIFVKITMLCLFFPGLFVPLLLTLDFHDAQTNSKMEVITGLGEEATINWTTKVVRVKGNGFGPENVKELGRRKILAKRAAQLDAYRNLLEAVKGVQVTSDISLENMMQESNTVTTQTIGMVKGMRLVEVVYSNDGGCEVTVEVNIDEQGNFLLATLTSGEVKVRDNYPKFDWVAQREELEKIKTDYAFLAKELNKKNQELISSWQNNANNFSPGQPGRSVKAKNDKNNRVMVAQEQSFNPLTANKDYTGLLVDARGASLKPVLAPVILNEKQEKMYGIGAIPSKISGGAIVSYVYGNIERAKRYKEIGDNPLVVKCIKTVNQSDIMLSCEDAQKVMFINELLEQKKVAVLI